MRGGTDRSVVTPSQRLDRLLAPRSVAVVGANDRPGSYADTVLRNLERAEFAGPVWGVHPTRTQVHGRDCVPSLLDLPEPVDAVVVAIPAAGVNAVLAEAIAAGCGGAIVFAAGFGEVSSGLGLEAELRDLALGAGFAGCGPNGNGIVAVGARAPLWGDSVGELRPGRVAMISQSGNVAVNAIGSRRGIDFHTLVSTGNQTVLDASDWLAAIAASDGVGSVAMFCESDGDGAKLAEALAICADRGVGVAVLKVGASPAGTRSAAAHTGAVAGEQRIFRALIEEAGAIWASDPHELLELAKALAQHKARPRQGGGLAVLTCSGGDSGLAADEAQRLGLELPEFSPASCGRLAELLPDAATVANPLDYTSLIWSQGDRLHAIAATVGDDPAIDQVLLCFDQPHGLASEHEEEWRTAREALAAGALDSDAAPMLASTLPDLLDDAAARELGERGVPAIAGLSTALVCAKALRASTGDGARMREIAGATRRSQAAAGRATNGDGWIGEAQAKAMLRAGGIAVPRGAPASGAEECVAAASEIGYPVALKLSGAAIQHKSDAGALVLDLPDAAAVFAAAERLIALPQAHGAELLVERMEKPGVELFVAARADAVIPVLVIGLGGIWTESLDDVAVIPLSASPARIERALGGLRAADALRGARGGAAVDLAALAALASRVGELLTDHGLTLLELNPVVARPDGAVALDAIART